MFNLYIESIFIDKKRSELCELDSIDDRFDQ